jgi:hypothetical protein
MLNINQAYMQFRDLKISSSELTEKERLNKVNDTRADIEENIAVQATHIIFALKKFIKGEMTQEQLGEWADNILKRNIYEISEESEEVHDSIVSVLSNLALICQGMAINNSDIYRYIDALESNISMPLELDRIPRPFYQLENIKKYPKAHSSE